jgi:hypothetical protein
MRALIALGTALFAAACSSSTTGSGDDGGSSGGLPNNIVNPVVFERFLEDVGVPAAEGLIDGLNRLIAAIGGGPADGVTIIPSGGNSVSVQLAADLDGDGSRESTIFGAATGDLFTGATVSITSVAVPAIPSLTATASAGAEVMSATTVGLDNITGTTSMDEPGSQNAADAVTTAGSLEVDLVAATVSGFLDCLISGEGQQLVVRLAFEGDGAGGWPIRVTGAGVDFTVP